MVVEPIILAVLGAAVLAVAARQFVGWRMDKSYQWAAVVLTVYTLYVYVAGVWPSLPLAMALVVLGILGTPPVSKALRVFDALVSKELAFTFIFFGALLLFMFSVVVPG